MIWPIKLYITEESLVIFIITIPIFLVVKKGFKPDNIITDRPIAPKITWMTGTPKNCLHAYVLQFRFRIRSKKCMKVLKESSKKMIITCGHGWQQVFTSAMI